MNKKKKSRPHKSPAKREKQYEVAYICNGLNPKCRGTLGCYYQELTNGMHGGCMHTKDKRYALNEILEDNPKNHPDRFDKYESGDIVRYYEKIAAKT